MQSVPPEYSGSWLAMAPTLKYRSFTSVRRRPYILGNGATPITDPHSQLHSRADYPFAIDDSYVSVSTQKFTMAPENAYRLEEMLFGDPS